MVPLGRAALAAGGRRDKLRLWYEELRLRCKAPSVGSDYKNLSSQRHLRPGREREVFFLEAGPMWRGGVC